MEIRKLGTEIGSEFVDKFYYPHTSWKKPQEKFLKLPSKYSFDLDEMIANCQSLRNEFALKPFPFVDTRGQERERLSYKGLGLTSRPEAIDPLYDGLRLYGENGALNIYDTFAKMSERLSGENREIAILDDTKFSKKTEACSPYFDKIVENFNSDYSKVRLLELMPGGVIPPHVDFPYYKCIRVHAAVTTNPDVVWEVEGETFTIPADGNFYWFDTGRYHAVKNNGKSPRLVLSINILLYQDRNGISRFTENDPLETLIEKGML